MDVQSQALPPGRPAPRGCVLIAMMEVPMCGLDPCSDIPSLQSVRSPGLAPRCGGGRSEKSYTTQRSRSQNTIQNGMCWLKGALRAGRR